MRTIRTPRKFARSAPTGQAEARMASPVGTASPMPRPSRNAGSFRGGMSGYRVPGVATTENAAQERALIQSRSADLTANDWAASSAVNAITTNAVGQGLQPQSDLDWERLGISEQEALELQDAIERVWDDWVPTADVRGMMHFGDRSQPLSVLPGQRANSARPDPRRECPSGTAAWRTPAGHQSPRAGVASRSRNRGTARIRLPPEAAPFKRFCGDTPAIPCLLPTT